jgi:riboflavin synthase
MFTGIIEHIGTIEALDVKDDGGRVTIHAPSIAPSLAVSNSIAVNGCCLTVVDLHDYRLSADLSGETTRKTSFGAKGGDLRKGARVNLEQALTAGKEFGGHFVLGHVDTIGRVTHLTPEGENWWFGVQVPPDFARYVVSKGSITIDGISLTVARWQNSLTPKWEHFAVEVAVIPYTYEHTNIRDRKPGDAVNLEGDVLGKYVERFLPQRHVAAPLDSQLTVARLLDEGF